MLKEPNTHSPTLSLQYIHTHLHKLTHMLTYPHIYLYKHIHTTPHVVGMHAHKNNLSWIEFIHFAVISQALVFLTLLSVLDKTFPAQKDYCCLRGDCWFNKVSRCTCRPWWCCMPIPQATVGALTRCFTKAALFIPPLDLAWLRKQDQRATQCIINPLSHNPNWNQQGPGCIHIYALLLFP